MAFPGQGAGGSLGHSEESSTEHAWHLLRPARTIREGRASRLSALACAETGGLMRSLLGCSSHCSREWSVGRATMVRALRRVRHTEPCNWLTTSSMPTCPRNGRSSCSPMPTTKPRERGKIRTKFDRAALSVHVLHAVAKCGRNP